MVGAEFGTLQEGAGPMSAYEKMYCMNFKKMDCVFKDMIFSAAYLFKFVENIDGVDFVRLVLSPDMPDDDGNRQPQPAIIKHTMGSKAKFRYMLSPGSPDDDDDESDEDEDDSGDEDESEDGDDDESGDEEEEDDGEEQ